MEQDPGLEYQKHLQKLTKRAKADDLLNSTLWYGAVPGYVGYQTIGLYQSLINSEIGLITAPDGDDLFSTAVLTTGILLMAGMGRIWRKISINATEPFSAFRYLPSKATPLQLIRPDLVNISREEEQAFYQNLVKLPTVGGKIPVKNGSFKKRLTVPSLSAEEQIDQIGRLRDGGRLGRAYVCQFTAESRADDEFKYVALALIASTPGENDWTKPFFKAEWGKVAPLIHDGGGGKYPVLPDSWRDKFIQPWKNGRTDFLERISIVREPKLPVYHPLSESEIIKLKPERRLNYQLDLLDWKIFEDQFKAYQRLTYAYWYKESSEWQNFKKEFQMLLGEFDIGWVSKPEWFTFAPRRIWKDYYYRYEADPKPIQAALMALEEAKGNNPALIFRARDILTKYTLKVDQSLGLKS